MKTKAYDRSGSVTSQAGKRRGVLNKFRLMLLCATAELGDGWRYRGGKTDGHNLRPQGTLRHL